MDAYDEFFARYPADVQAISRQLRALVLSALPQAREVLVERHDHIGYDFNDSSRGRVMYLCPLQNYVRLGFMYGAQLDDPQHLLLGEGKRLRHIKVWSQKDAGNPALLRLVQAAWANAVTHMPPSDRPAQAQP